MPVEATALKGFEKIIELIKSSGWQTAAATIAFGAWWYLVQSGLLPPFDPPWLAHIVAFGFLLSSMLTLAAICSALVMPISSWVGYRRSERALVAQVEAAVPFMTEQERAIIGYLLHHNQKVFDAEDDGGYAASLLGRGFIVILARRGQMVDMTRVPMIVPDTVWEVWQRHKDKFPYKPTMNGGHEVHPWRIPWMVR